ncbi:MAG: hypothetical protein KAR20_15370 [Candidatus Heimdallarchaeota archaeon]|nr:hypothetical protein [Candidatus Heimdallarchaeota archaeon]
MKIEEQIKHKIKWCRRFHNIDNAKEQLLWKLYYRLANEKKWNIFNCDIRVHLSMVDVLKMEFTNDFIVLCRLIKIGRFDLEALYQECQFITEYSEEMEND